MESLGISANSLLSFIDDQNVTSIDFSGTKLWPEKKQELLKHNNFYFFGFFPYLDLWISSFLDL